jgi:hypothetical protein
LKCGCCSFGGIGLLHWFQLGGHGFQVSLDLLIARCDLLDVEVVQLQTLFQYEQQLLAPVAFQASRDLLASGSHTIMFVCG